MDFVNTYDISNGDVDIILTRSEKFEDKASVQVDVDATFDGTNSTVELVQSNDRDLDAAQWHPLPEPALILAVSDSSLLSTFGFTARFLALRIVKGDANDGILTLTSNFKR